MKAKPLMGLSEPSNCPIGRRHLQTPTSISHFSPFLSTQTFTTNMHRHQSCALEPAVSFQFGSICDKQSIIIAPAASMHSWPLALPRRSSRLLPVRLDLA